MSGLVRVRRQFIQKRAMDHQRRRKRPYSYIIQFILDMLDILDRANKCGVFLNEEPWTNPGQTLDQMPLHIHYSTSTVEGIHTPRINLESIDDKV